MLTKFSSSLLVVLDVSLTPGNFRIQKKKLTDSRCSHKLDTGINALHAFPHLILQRKKTILLTNDGKDLRSICPCLRSHKPLVEKLNLNPGLD